MTLPTTLSLFRTSSAIWDLGEAGFWALIDPSDDTMVQGMRNHVLGGAQLEKQTNEVATVSFDIIVVHVFPLRWLLKRLAFGSWSSEAPCATPPSHHPCHPPPIHFDSVLNTISSICALLQMSLGSLGALVCGRPCARTPSYTPLPTFCLVPPPAGRRWQ